MLISGLKELKKLRYGLRKRTSPKFFAFERSLFAIRFNLLHS